MAQKIKKSAKAANVSEELFLRFCVFADAVEKSAAHAALNVKSNVWITQSNVRIHSVCILPVSKWKRKIENKREMRRRTTTENLLEQMNKRAPAITMCASVFNGKYMVFH